MNQPRRRKILLVDDEVSLRRLVLMTLERDYDIVEAGDGEEAIALTMRERPDLVLMDVHLPKLDGFEACRRIKSDPATQDVKVIMVTVATGDISRRIGVEMGADGYITKPYSPSVLRWKVEEIFR